jgi:hypothetical protein
MQLQHPANTWRMCTHTNQAMSCDSGQQLAWGMGDAHIIGETALPGLQHCQGSLPESIGGIMHWQSKQGRL